MGDILLNSMDFTLTAYQKLLETLIENNYSFLTVEEFTQRRFSDLEKVIERLCEKAIWRFGEEEKMKIRTHKDLDVYGIKPVFSIR